MIITQTGAMFYDAFRELHARKLFWITMGLSLVVVLLFAFLGIDKNTGVTFAIWTIPDSQEFAQRVPAGLFYRYLLIQIGVNFWLAWIAVIIGLISTAGIIPSLVSSGAIDTMLSKPIGRTRLFLTKYLTGLLFVVLQVGVFAIGSILVIGLRSGSWEWGLLLAVPIVTVFFSYLFSISALVGLLSRSALTAVLITGLVWFLIFLVNLADGGLITNKAGAAFERDYAEAQIEWQTRQIARLEERVAQEEAADDADSRTIRRLADARSRLQKAREDRDQGARTYANLAPWHRGVYIVKTTLPKTGETVGLLERWLVDTSELREIFPGMFDSPPLAEEGEETIAPADPTRVKSTQARVNEEVRSRSLWWIIGTSLLFEGLIIVICCVIFVRRDF